jgi:glycosyltransferase involved in cell wall biosynthesis
MSTSSLLDREPTVTSQPSFDGHVVFLTSYIPPHTLGVYQELAKRVRKLTVLISTPMESHRNWKPDWGSLDVKIQRTLTVQRPWRHPAGFSENMAIHVPLDTVGQLRSLRPDVIISGQMGARSLLSAVYSGLSRVPLVLYASLSEHHERGHGRVRHVLRRFLLRRAKCVGVNGGSGARYLQKFGIPADRLIHVPYAAVPHSFDSLPLNRPADDAHRLLFVGQLVQRKGLEPFIEALATWAAQNPNRNVDFSLAGSGPLEGELRSMPIPENLYLRWLGELSFDKLAECYAHSGILAFPTLADEWGLVVNEAMAAGLPVLGSVYSQAVEELCSEGQTGWRFRPDSTTEMVDAIDRALGTSVDSLNAMRAQSRERVAHLTPAYVADRFLTTIHTATSEVPAL